MGATSDLSDRGVYEIKVEGLLDGSWLEWFGPLTIVAEERSDGKSFTTLTGATDQAELRGILDTMWNLNVVLISVISVDRNSPKVPFSKEGSVEHYR